MALKRPSTRRRAKTSKRKGQGSVTAETRRLFGGSSGPGRHASSWKAPLFHGMRLYGRPNEDRRPSWLRPCNNPFSCLAIWRSPSYLTTGPFQVAEERHGYGKRRLHLFCFLIPYLLICYFLLIRPPFSGAGHSTDFCCRGVGQEGSRRPEQ